MKSVKPFTLIELLVAIAIIAILASLLLPVLTGAKKRAREIVCLGQLRQNGMGLLMYTDDNNQYWPWRSEGAGYGINKWSWDWYSGVDNFDMHVVIEEYVPKGENYICPFADGSWQDYWPQPGSTDYGPFYRWSGYATFANYASHTVTFVTPSGAVAPWDEVVAQRRTDFPGRPILGDQLTYDPSRGWVNWHRGEPEFSFAHLRHSYVFPDGRGELIQQGFVDLTTYNAKGWKQAWFVYD